MKNFIPTRDFCIGRDGHLVSGWTGRKDLRGLEVLATLQYHQNVVEEDAAGFYRVLYGKKRYLKLKLEGEK